MSQFMEMVEARLSGQDRKALKAWLQASGIKEPESRHQHLTHKTCDCCGKKALTRLCKDSFFALATTDLCKKCLAKPAREVSRTLYGKYRRGELNRQRNKLKSKEWEIFKFFNSFLAGPERNTSLEKMRERAQKEFNLSRSEAGQLIKRWMKQTDRPTEAIHYNASNAGSDAATPAMLTMKRWGANRRGAKRSSRLPKHDEPNSRHVLARKYRGVFGGVLGAESAGPNDYDTGVLAEGWSCAILHSKDMTPEEREVMKTLRKVVKQSAKALGIKPVEILVCKRRYQKTLGHFSDFDPDNWMFMVPRTHLRDKDDVEDTAKHEMVHAWQAANEKPFGHGREFKKMLATLRS